MQIYIYSIACVIQLNNLINTRYTQLIIMTVIPNRSDFRRYDGSDLKTYLLMRW